MSTINTTDTNATLPQDSAERLQEQGFAAQSQRYPGSTQAMKPIPDHGEKSWVGHDRLSGLRALITGGDSGIGRATAIAYAREGADVVIAYLREEQADAEDTRDVINGSSKGRCSILKADIRNESAARSLVDGAAKILGGLDILVNNAGYQWGRREHGLESVTTEEMTRVFDTNLKGTFWVTQQALQYMKKGASIINLSSIQAYSPSPSLVDYAATKAALANFTASLAQELGPRGIRANAVAPGPIWTPLQPATKNSEEMPDFGKGVPLGRAGQPVELSGTMVFLASPAEASYVSGTVIGVTGGKPIF